MKEDKRCPHCEAKMVEYKHTLNKNLSQILGHMAGNEGRFILERDAGLFTHNQMANQQKLRYWGLIQSVEKHSGSWDLTSLGWRFVCGKVGVQKSVWTYRGDPVRFEGDTVYFKDLGWEPYDRMPDYVASERLHIVYENGQLGFL